MKPDEIPFNFKPYYTLYFYELHELRKAKAQAVIANNIRAYFDSLEEIYIHISFKLDDKEIQSIEEKFSNAYEFLMSDAKGSNAQLIKQSAILEAKNVLKEIDMFLLKLMHKYKMIFPNIPHPSFDTIDTKYEIK